MVMMQSQLKRPMTDASERSLGDDATFAGSAPRQRADGSLGDERTLGGAASGQDTIVDDIEVVDLEARYKIDGTLGQGGMGAVLLAIDTRLDRKVAIKRILGEAAGNRMALQRFLTEAKSIAALNHPNIVQIYDYGRAKDGPFLIMEFVDGGSLLDRCRDSAMPLEDAVDLACQLCDGLAKAHDLGIIHRDIKPANVLLTKEGTPKLTDFGLAKAKAGDHGQTMTGAVLGTPDFMPPEQRKDARLVDARSDLWSLAATVYQMATGRSPKIIRFDLLPKELTKVLGKALEDSKDDRYQTARELRDALKASLRVASFGSAIIAEGQCPSCGTQNDSSRRFCRGCGGTLEAPCLSCDMPLPMWEEICGRCGTKQSLLSQQRRNEMAAAQSKAETLLGNFDLDQAVGMARSLGNERHARLSFLKSWAEEFVARVERIREQQARRAAELLAEARGYEAAHDYWSAVSALESVPQLLRKATVVGASESVESALKRVREKQTECQRLHTLIKDRVERKELVELDQEIDKLLLLEPANPDVLKLKVRLADRERRIQEQRHAALKARQRDDEMQVARQRAACHAEKLLNECLYKEAAASLANLAPEVMTTELVALREQAIVRHDEACRLKQEIKSALATGDEQTVVAALDSYQSLMPIDPDAKRLRQTLTATSLYCDKVRQLLSDGKWRQAFDDLASVPMVLARMSATHRVALYNAAADARQRNRDAVAAEKQQCLESRRVVVSATRIAAIVGGASCLLWAILSPLLGVALSSSGGSFNSFIWLGTSASFTSFVLMPIVLLTPYLSNKRSGVAVLLIEVLLAGVATSTAGASPLGCLFGCIPVIAVAFYRMPSLLYWLCFDLEDLVKRYHVAVVSIDLHTLLCPAVDVDAKAIPSPTQLSQSDLLALLRAIVDTTHMPIARIHLYPDIQGEMLQTAIKSYALGVRPEDILLLHENPTWGGRTRGMCVTADELFWQNKCFCPHRIRFLDVRDLKAADGSSLLVNEGLVAVRSEALSALLRVITEMAALRKLAGISGVA